jgi:hypothetical protein
MPHMQLILDGENVYDEHIDNWAAPPRPDMIPAAVRAQTNPNVKPAPFLKAIMLAMIGKAIEASLRDPRLAPLTVNLTKRPTGFTITVDMPPPANPQADADYGAEWTDGPAHD